MAWLTGWQYRKKITISGSSGAGTNYQVLLKVGESSGATGAHFHVEGHSAIFPSGKNNSGDLRFTSSDGQTLLDFWVEQVTGTSPNRIAYCWVKVSANLDTNQDIYCYFGNPSSTNVSNGDNTFLFFDDFLGTSINTSKWTIVDSSGWSVLNDELKGTNSTGRLRSNTVFSAPIILEVKVRTVTLAPNGQTIGGFWNSTTDGFTLLQHPSPDYVRNDGSWVSLGGDVIPEGNTPILIRFTVVGTTVGLTSINLNTGATTYNNSFTNTVASETIMIGRRADDNPYYLGQTYETYWDWVRVRKYASPEPTFSSAGPEEMLIPASSRRLIIAST